MDDTFSSVVCVCVCVCVCVLCVTTLRRIFVLMGEDVTGVWMEMRIVTICSPHQILSGLSK